MKGGGLRSPFALCSMKQGRNPRSRTVSLSPQILSPSSSVFQTLIQSSLTSMLTVIRLIETQLLDPLSTNSLYWVRWAQIPFTQGPSLKIVILQYFIAFIKGLGPCPLHQCTRLNQRQETLILAHLCLTFNKFSALLIQLEFVLIIDFSIKQRLFHVKFMRDMNKT